MPKQFEEALESTQNDIEVAIKAAQGAVAALKRVQKATQTGDVKPLSRHFEAVDMALERLTETIKMAHEGWQFDTESYLDSGEYFEELMEAAREAGVSIYEMDGKLFCYPCILQVIPRDSVVKVDKKREKRLRPTFFVKQLQKVQNKPMKSKSSAFLESIFTAYTYALAQKGKADMMGIDIQLQDIYNVLTLLPGQKTDYSKQDFTRDIYLLDQSNTTVTKKGFQVSFPSASGTKSPSRCLKIVTRDGHEKLYYAIAFNDVN